MFNYFHTETLTSLLLQLCIFIINIIINITIVVISGLITMINLNISRPCIKINIILALRLELVIAYQVAGDYSFCSSVTLVCHSLVCVCPWFGTVNTRGQRISASTDIGGAA